MAHFLTTKWKPETSIVHILCSAITEGGEKLGPIIDATYDAYEQMPRNLGVEPFVRKTPQLAQEAFSTRRRWDNNRDSWHGNKRVPSLEHGI